MLNNYAYRSPLEPSSIFWKSGRITKPRVGRLQIQAELHRRRRRGNFPKSLTNIHSCFSWRNFPSITIKSNQFAGKNAGRLIFWRNKESKFLLDTLQSKNMNNKDSQVLLVSRKNSSKWNLRVKFRADELHRTYCS